MHPEIKAYWEQQGYVITEDSDHIGKTYYGEEKDHREHIIAYEIGGTMNYYLTLRGIESPSTEEEALRLLKMKAFW